MSTSDAYIGAGTTLSLSYYLRSYYHSNLDARTSSTRNQMSSTALSVADSYALRKAVRELGSWDYSDSQDTNIRNSVSAYIQTYNNLLSSASSSSDHTLERTVKQLKNLTKEYSSELNEIGITVNDDGTLTGRESLLSSADLSKFQSLFSRDSVYMQRTTAYTKRLMQRSSTLDTIATQKTRKEASDSKASSAASTTDTVSSIVTAALATSDSADLNTLLNNGIGQNVNVVL